MSSSTEKKGCPQKIIISNTRVLTLEDNHTQVRVFKSMDTIVDKTGAEMSIHLRQYQDGNVEVIVNRSCQECKSFRKFGNQEICDKCSYVKNWLQDGCY